ncbi:flagellar basal body protein, partial [Stenotrophomonas maltophilia]|uniref:flagellar basal body protein n=1 Tax=Stenotrophomonas maltophilia TaxID=40324 RepID=UPI001EF809D2
MISNNIANMRTTGFKRQRAEFQDMLYDQQRRAGMQNSQQGNVLPVGIAIGSGVKPAATSRVMSQGN